VGAASGNRGADRPARDAGIGSGSATRADVATKPAQHLIRVLIADDDSAVRAALAALMRTDPGLELVGVAGDADEAIELARHLRPDLALLDVRMPAGGGPRAAREIRECSPETRVVALSAYGDRGAVMEMLGSGADGYLVKGTSAAEIIETIRRTVNGDCRTGSSRARRSPPAR